MRDVSCAMRCARVTSTNRRTSLAKSSANFLYSRAYRNLEKPLFDSKLALISVALIVVKHVSDTICEDSTH